MAVPFARRRRRRSLPVGLPRTDQVRALLAVLDEAVTALRFADEAVAACGAPGKVSGQAAERCGRAGSTFHRLQARLGGLPLTEADLVEAQAYAGRLLAYDQWMVRQSLDLAFTLHPGASTEAARLQINGLGRPADDLRRLRDALRQNGSGPVPGS
ncbi:hypothetical protein [Streptomyces sp. HUCO-GS316]|uniref:hypothetical protein n=1 Tax=Streptomyces sp. HUCO-GS316 TaxID=2692198 RepID=UPI001F16FC79|nr:hypothetical protein [Streptomyces sp. HUCO-GS316]